MKCKEIQMEIRRKFCLLIVLSISVATGLFAQFDPIPSPDWIEEHKDSLRNALLTNKDVEPNYEHAILAALMYYPNLEEIHINFKTRNITTTMAAMPTVGSIFRKRENRRYSILINETQNRRKAPLLKNAPFEARVGVIGHELAHIVDYNRKSFIRIIGNGIGYVFSNSFKRNLEHKIDRITINKGLGEGLYAFRLFVEDEANTTERYRKFKDNIYMSSTDIAQLIETVANLAHED
ncbi:MAG: hypothetical protein RBT19_13675 [Tenuifilaceae bacterium]|nr:hypothetical protein [Tenuifilaceae bacterium]